MKKVLVLCLFILGCTQNQSTIGNNNPQIEFLQSAGGLISTPDSGEVSSTGADATVTLTIKTNSSALRTENISLSSGSQGFSLLTTSCPNINNTRSCTVRVKFTVGSKANGDYLDNVIIGDLSVPVIAHLQKPAPVSPLLQVSADSLEITSIDMGTVGSSQSLTKMIVVKDLNKKSTQNLQLFVAGVNFTALTSTCTFTSLNSAAGCSVRLSFSGSGKPAGVTTDSLMIGSQSMPISGIVAASAQTPPSGTAEVLFADSMDQLLSSVDFGSVAANGKSSLIIKLKNQGTAYATSSLALSGSAAFYVTGSSCSSVLLAGATCQLTVNISSATLRGIQSATISYAGKTLPLSVNIQGDAVAPVSGLSVSLLTQEEGLLAIQKPSENNILYIGDNVRSGVINVKATACTYEGVLSIKVKNHQNGSELSSQDVSCQDLLTGKELIAEHSWTNKKVDVQVDYMSVSKPAGSFDVKYSFAANRLILMSGTAMTWGFNPGGLTRYNEFQIIRPWLLPVSYQILLIDASDVSLDTSMSPTFRVSSNGVLSVGYSNGSETIKSTFTVKSVNPNSEFLGLQNPGYSSDFGVSYVGYHFRIADANLERILSCSANSPNITFISCGLFPPAGSYSGGYLEWSNSSTSNSENSIVLDTAGTIYRSNQAMGRVE